MQRILVVAVLALAACASSSNQGPSPNHATASGTGSGSNMICHEETPTGSSFSRTVCRSPDEVEQDRKDAEDLVRSRGVAVPPPDL